MTTPSPHDVTQRLLAWSDGDREALDELIPLVYDHLRQLARRYMHELPVDELKANQRGLNLPPQGRFHEGGIYVPNLR